jgi:hypothetical protein
VLGVVLAREGLRDLQEPRGAEVVAAALEARDDLAAQPATDAVRLDEHECRLDRHAAAQCSRRR